MEKALPVTIRQATADDIPAIIELASFAESSASWAGGKYEDRIKGSSGIVLVAETAGGIAGFIVMHLIAGECEIENIAVVPNLRRKGIGRRLVSDALDVAESQRCTAVWLEVRESNVAAKQLYKALGLEEISRRRAYYHDPEEDALILRLTI